MAINLEFGTHQKLLRAAGLMNMSVQGLANKLLAGACDALDPERIRDMMQKAAEKAAHDMIVSAVGEPKPMGTFPEKPKAGKKGRDLLGNAQP